MARVISVKMNDVLFVATDRAAKKLNLPRNAYINKAVSFFNRLFWRKLLKAELAKESRWVSQESLAVLQEFEEFEDELP